MVLNNIFSRKMENENFGNYRIIREIARGGMGIIYEAHGLGSQDVVALKVLLSGSDSKNIEIQRFLRESKVTFQLKHSHIIPVYDMGDVGGVYYFTMKYVRGDTFEKILQEKVSLKRKLTIFVKVCQAIAYAHENKVIHRDLKPSNILMDEDFPYVTDFGLVKNIDSESKLTQTGTSVGTPFYMSPEQVKGMKTGTQTDVYSLGVILYQILTRRLPFKSDSVINLYQKINSEEPIKPSHFNPRISKKLEAICLKAMEKKPSLRYKTAKEMAEDLENYFFHRKVNASKFNLNSLVYHTAFRYGFLLKIFFAVFLCLFISLYLWKITSRRAEKYEAIKRRKECTKQCLFLQKEFKKGEYSKVVKMLKKTAKKYSDFYLPSFVLAKCYYQLNDNIKAERAFEQARKLSPENPTLLYEYGQFYERQALYKKALPLIEKYIKKMPNAPRGYRKRATILQALGNRKLADKDIKKANQIQKEKIEKLLFCILKASMSKVKAEREESLLRFQHLLKQYPQYERGYLERAKLYEERKEFYNALKDISQAAELNPCRKYFFQKGLYQKKLKYWEESEKSFRKALSLLQEGLSDQKIITELAQAKLFLHKYKSCFSLLKGRDKTVERNRFYYAKAAYGCKFNIISQYEFSKLATQEIPDFMKGEVYYYLGLLENTPERKNEFWEKAAQFDFPQKILLFHRLGKMYYEQKKFTKACYYLEKAAQKEFSVNTEISYLLGESYMKLDSPKEKHFKKAILAYSGCIKVEPWKSHYYYKRGLAYTKLKEYQLAEENFIRCSKLKPENMRPSMKIISNCFDQGIIYNYDKVQFMLTNFHYVGKFSFDLFEKEKMKIGRFYREKALIKVKEKIQKWTKRQAEVYINGLKNSDSPAIHAVAKSALISMYRNPHLQIQLKKMFSEQNKTLLPIVKKRFRDIYRVIRKKYLERKKIQYAQLLARYYNGQDQKALLEIYHSGQYAIDILKELLHDKAILAYWAAQCLQDLKTAASLNALKQLSRSNHFQTKVISHLVLNSKIDSFQTKSLDPYLRALFVRNLPLSKKNRSCLNILLKAIEDSDERVRLYAAKRLRHVVPEKAEKKLLEAFQSPFAVLRAYALSVYWDVEHLQLSVKDMKKWKARSDKQMNFLIKATQDKDPLVRSVAFTQLGKLKKKEYVNILEKGIEDKDDLVRFYALLALGFTGSDRVQKVIHDIRKPLLSRAAAMLGLLEAYTGAGEDQMPFRVFSQFTKLMKDKDYRVRTLAFITAGRARTSILVAFLRDIFRIARKDHAAMVGSIIASLRRAPKSLYSSIKKMMTHPNKEVRIVATLATFFIGYTRKIKDIKSLHRKLKKSSKKYLKQAAATGYVRIIRQNARYLSSKSSLIFSDWNLVYKRYIHDLHSRLREKAELKKMYLDVYNKAIDLDKETGTYWFERGIVYYSMKKYKKSLENVQKAFKIFQTSNSRSRAWERFSHLSIFKFWLTKIYYDMKEYEKAYHTAKEVLQVDPWNEEILKIQAKVLKSQKRR